MSDFKKSLGFTAKGADIGDIKTKGFQAGYKPPASFFNWLFNTTHESIEELHDYLTAKTIRAEADLNQITDIGMYVYSAADSASIGNTPEKAQSTLLVLPRLLPNDTANRVQVVITQTNTLYIRNRTGSTWEKWTQLRKTTDIVPIKYGGTEATNVTDARKNLGLPETCVQITDWNEATKTGWYMANNAENAPTINEGGTAWYFGFVIAHATGYVFQEVYQFSISASAIIIPKYIRAKTAGTWGQWYDVTVQRTVPQLAKLDFVKTLTSDAQEQFNNIYQNKMNKNPDCIEITPADGANNGGYIDFHFGGSDKDYTSRIIEESESVLLMRAALKVEGNLYENSNNRVYSTGHKPTPADIGAAEAVKHKLITYSSLADIGLTAGSETIVNIASKMADNSILVYQTDSASANIYPQSSLVVTVKRVNTNRVEFFATRVNGSQLWFGNYHKDSGWTGWKEIYHEGALPTPAKIGAATSGHGHSLTDSVITGALPITKGGTGATSASGALSNLGLTATATELNYMDGVTSNVQTQLNGKASSSHNHSASNINSGTLSSDRLPTVPIAKGGTGATDVSTARTNLGFIQGSYTGNGSSSARTINIGGTGYALLIWSSTNTMKAIVTPEGGTVWYDDGAWAALTEDNTDKKCYFKNGVLYLQVGNITLSTSYCNLMNKSGATYYYQVL